MEHGYSHPPPPSHFLKHSTFWMTSKRSGVPPEETCHVYMFLPSCTASSFPTGASPTQLQILQKKPLLASRSVTVYTSTASNNWNWQIGFGQLLCATISIWLRCQPAISTLHTIILLLACDSWPPLVKVYQKTRGVKQEGRKQGKGAFLPFFLSFRTTLTTTATLWRPFSFLWHTLLGAATYWCDWHFFLCGSSDLLSPAKFQIQLTVLLRKHQSSGKPLNAERSRIIKS